MLFRWPNKTRGLRLFVLLQFEDFALEGGNRYCDLSQWVFHYFWWYQASFSSICMLFRRPNKTRGLRLFVLSQFEDFALEGEISIVSYLSEFLIIPYDLRLHSYLFACRLNGPMRREACAFLFFHSLRISLWRGNSRYCNISQWLFHHCLWSQASLLIYFHVIYMDQ